MTLNEYIENPMGKGDAALGQNRKVIVATLTSKYESLTERKEIKMKCYTATLAAPTKYYIHLTIPSETERENTYDVVFEFTKNMSKPMKDWNVKVFSNSPSFAYTFAYVYLKHDLMIKHLANKLGKEFQRKAPEVRNRFQIVGFEKYVFFGAMFIRDSKILSEEAFKKKATSHATNSFPGKVRTLDEIMKEYDAAKGKLEKKKRQEKKAAEDSLKKEMRRPQKVEGGIHKVAKAKKQVAHPAGHFKEVRHIPKRK